MGAPERGRLLPGDADPGHRRRERGVRHGEERHGAARPGHDQRARGADSPQHGQGCEGVVPHRSRRARCVVPAVGRRVQGGPRDAGHEADARLPGADRVVPDGERVPILRVLRQHRRRVSRLRAVPPQRRGPGPGDRAQVLQPPRRAARRRLRRGEQAGELQRRARRGLRDRVAVQGRRERARRRARQRRRVQRQPGAPRAVRQRRHPAPPRRRRRRVPLRAVQREPEAGTHLRAQLRCVLPEPAEGLRRRVHPRRRWQQQRQWQRRPRVAGERRIQPQQRRRRRRGQGDDDRGGVVRGERDGGAGTAPGRAGLRVRPRRRGLQGHPARRGVLRAEHHGGARLLRLQRLLPAQGPVHRHLLLRRRCLRRQPGTNDGQVRATVDGLKKFNEQKRKQQPLRGTRFRSPKQCHTALSVLQRGDDGILRLLILCLSPFDPLFKGLPYCSFDSLLQT